MSALAIVDDLVAFCEDPANRGAMTLLQQCERMDTIRRDLLTLRSEIVLAQAEGVREAIWALEMGRDEDSEGSYAHQSKGHALRFLRRYLDATDTPDQQPSEQERTHA